MMQGWSGEYVELYCFFQKSTVIQGELFLIQWDISCGKHLGSAHTNGVVSWASWLVLALTFMITRTYFLLSTVITKLFPLLPHCSYWAHSEQFTRPLTVPKRKSFNIA